MGWKHSWFFLSNCVPNLGYTLPQLGGKLLLDSEEQKLRLGGNVQYWFDEGEGEDVRSSVTVGNKGEEESLGM